MSTAVPTASSGSPDPGRSREPVAASDLRTVLRRRGLRCTPQRVAVVTLLAAHAEPDHHLTAAQVRRRLADTGHDLDASTVYRTLALLVEIGILHATAHADGATSYGVATDPHHHALCRRCGRLADIPAEYLSLALDQAARASSFQLSRDSLLLHGTCPGCVAAASSVR